MNATIRAKYDDPGYRDFCREITQRKWDRRKRRRDALAMTEGAKGVRLENESGGQLLIHPATRPDRESDWQLTTIGPDGKPWGTTIHRRSKTQLREPLARQRTATTTSTDTKSSR